MTRLRRLRRLPPSPRLRRTSRRGRLRQPVAATLLAAALVVWPAGSDVLGQSGVGRVTGVVKLTLASSAPSSASAYERRSVGPRPRPQSELKNVVIFFSDLPSNKPSPMQASIAQK